jgi:tetratricopeptide (TPR) repeat protein
MFDRLFTMKRYFLLLLPLLAFAATEKPSTKSGDKLASAASLWADSLKAEQEVHYDEALEKIAEFGKQGGDRYLVALRTAWLNYLKADYNTAATAYAAASTLQPSAMTPLLGGLSTAIAQGNASKISKAAEAVLKVDPSNYKANMVLANASFAIPDYRRAHSLFRRMLTFYPEDIDATSGAAWSAFYIGEKKGAQDGFKKILSLNPEYPYAQRGLDLSSGTAPPNGKAARPAK